MTSIHCSHSYLVKYNVDTDVSEKLRLFGCVTVKGNGRAGGGGSEG